MKKSLEEALKLYDVPPLDLLVYSRLQMAAVLVYCTNLVVSQWGYLWFLSHCGVRGKSLDREKQKLFDSLGGLQQYSVEGANSARVKKAILDLHWGYGNRSIPGRELLTDARAVAAIISGKLYEEGVGVSDDVCVAPSRAFMKDAPALIKLISHGTREDVRQYLDMEFPSAAAPHDCPYDWARVGFFDGLDILIRTDDPVVEPCFHVVDQRAGRFDIAVSLTEPRRLHPYFDASLADEYKKKLGEFMRSAPQQKYFATHYEQAVFLWNDQNPQGTYVNIVRDEDGNAIIPDHSALN